MESDGHEHGYVRHVRHLKKSLFKTWRCPGRQADCNYSNMLLDLIVKRAVYVECSLYFMPRLTLTLLRGKGEGGI